MERIQKVPKKKIRKLRPGRPKLTERGASTIPDILSIHEQTVLLALLCNGWGEEWPHDWDTWRAMLPHYLGSKF